MWLGAQMIGHVLDALFWFPEAVVIAPHRGCRARVALGGRPKGAGAHRDSGLPRVERVGGNCAEGRRLLETERACSGAPSFHGATPLAYQAYLLNNPNNESRQFHPMEEGVWIDEDEPELVSPSGTVTLRGAAFSLPSREQYQTVGIELQGDRPALFELCRFLAHHHRVQVAG